ncbi:MAG: 1-acyl-sn-glycerol-3-phosphate acyltransferase [Caldilineaceae bacterium]|nr:1-acyl-sn-glycerol-3-phosphate acyltransferase [Caldilineaceae bacterium]
MKFWQTLFFLLIVRPLVAIVLGLKIRSEENLPTEGPAIIAANHNSHLDTLTLMSLWPLGVLARVRPVAAADYFLTNAKLAWFSLNIMHIIPIDRQRKDKESDPLAEPAAALAHNEILVLFPEGSRGEPEQLSRFKSGMARLVERNHAAPIIPVFMHGLGKALPRGDFLLVPFFVDVVVGEPIYWRGSINETMQAYENAMRELAKQVEMPVWE